MVSTPSFVALVRADLQGLRNRLRRMDHRRLSLLAVAVPALAAAVLTPAVTLGVSLAGLGRGAAVGVLTLGFTTLGMVMLVVGLSSVMVSFFASRDLLLLALAPIRLGEVYVARLIVAARASGLIAVLLLAALVGYGAAAHAGPAYWVATPLMVLAVIFGATALQVSLLSAVVRIVPVARARTMVSIVAALLGSAFWMAWLLLRSQQVVNGTDSSLAQTAASASALGEHLVWLPTAWPARALAAFASGDVSAPLWTLTTLLATGTALLLGHAMFVQSFRRGLSALGEVRRRMPAIATPPPVGMHAMAAAHAMSPVRANRGRAVPLLSLVRKEWLVMRRDSRRLAALVPMCVIAAAYPLLGPGGGDGLDFWSSVLRGGSLSLMLPFFFTQILAAPSVALEGRAFMLMRLAPLDVATVLRAKVIAVAVPMSTATVVACVVLGLSRHGDALQVGTLVLMGLWLALGATAIGVGGGAIGARFDAEDPRRAVSIGAALGSTLASLSFLGVSILAALQLARSAGLVGRVPGVPTSSSSDALLGVALLLAIAVGIVVLMLSLAERRLAQWQPDGGRAPVVVPAPQWGPMGGFGR